MGLVPNLSIPHTASPKSRGFRRNLGDAAAYSHSRHAICPPATRNIAPQNFRFNRWAYLLRILNSLSIILGVAAGSGPYMAPSHRSVPTDSLAPISKVTFSPASFATLGVKYTKYRRALPVGLVFRHVTQLPGWLATDGASVDDIRAFSNSTPLMGVRLSATICL